MKSVNRFIGELQVAEETSRIMQNCGHIFLFKRLEPYISPALNHSKTTTERHVMIISE